MIRWQPRFLGKSEQLAPAQNPVNSQEMAANL
jgi:hypothetical protein